MTAWVEALYNGWFVCVRELQNFDGVHAGIKLVRMIVIKLSFLKSMFLSNLVVSLF